MSEQGSLLGFLSDPRLAPYATGDIPVWLWSADATRILWGNPAAAAIFNAASSDRTDRAHHRSQRLGGAADRAARRHAAAWLSAAAGAAARFRRTLGRRADVHLLADFARRSHAGHPGGRDGKGRVAASAEGAGAAAAGRLRRAGCAVFVRWLAAARDARRASKAWPRHNPRRAWRRSARRHGARRRPRRRRQCRRPDFDRTPRRRRFDRAAGEFCDRPPQPSTAAEPPAVKLRRRQSPSSRQSPAAAPASLPRRTSEPPNRRKPSRGSRPCRRRPSAASRFASSGRWTTTSRFTLDSDEFKALIGPQAAAALGQPWSDLATALGLDPEGQVARAFASRDTWSGITVAFPVDGTDARMTVELSGLPVFDRDRNFRGYRGFGICRDVARINELTKTRRAASPAASAASSRRCSATSARRLRRCRRR